MINRSFWTWAAWAGAGVITIAYLPSRMRIPLCVILLLGAGVYLERRGGGIAGLGRTLSSGGKE